jgi:hypothetical protein|tara:strand:+ start:2400 stop:2591 length:192 start_codon:yes stop_codon:yes gene_type:complete
MIIDKTILKAEREKLKSDFDNVTNTINTMKGNLHALNGAIQQVDKLLLMVDTVKPKTKKDENI